MEAAAKAEAKVVMKADELEQKLRALGIQQLPSP